MKRRKKNGIRSLEELKKIKDMDCVIVLGCGVTEDGVPTDMLKDRLDTAVCLYREGVSDTLLMSGDHGRDDYDEVNVMKKYAVSRGVPTSRVFMDHAGFSTYETMYRAKAVFAVDKAAVVTQEYHLPRALYIGKKLGIECYGYPADKRTYVRKTERKIREALAMIKDVFKCLFKPKPKYLGDIIPVSGDGDLTNDGK